MTKYVFGICSDRTEEFTRVAINFIKKWVHEIDDFYIITKTSSYNNFFSKIIDFPHKTIIVEDAKWATKTIGAACYKYGLELSASYDEDTIININGDGGFFVHNPFKWIQTHHNNFESFDIVNTIYRNHCFDTSCWFRNNERSQYFLKKLWKTCEDPGEIKVYDNNIKTRTVLSNLNSHPRWFVIQDLFWNIYLKNENVKFLWEEPKFLFVGEDYHWAGNSGSPVTFISTLYDSLFLENVPLVNLLGKFKYSVNQKVYQYYFDNIDDKTHMMNKANFIEIYSKIDVDSHKLSLEHYAKLFSEK